MDTYDRRSRDSRKRPTDTRLFDAWARTRFRDHPQEDDKACATAAEVHFEGVTEHTIALARRRLAPRPRGRAFEECKQYTPYVPEPIEATASQLSSRRPEPCPACDIRPDVAGNCLCG